MTKYALPALTVVALFAVSGESPAQVVMPGPAGPTVTFPGSGQVVGSPQYPVLVTPNIVTGFNPQTGGLNTANRQIDNSFFDYRRESSKYNGTRRWVRRPVYGAYGRIVGYQEGFVWNNSVTGREHGDLQSFTPNGSGGIHTGVVQRGRKPIHGSPTGVHVQKHSYSRPN